MQKILDSIAQLVFPKLCVCCEGYLSHQENLICDLCLLTLPKFEYYNRKDNDVAKKFWGRTNLIAATSVLQFSNSTAVKNILHQIKYKGNQPLGLEMGRMMGDVFKQVKLLSSVDILIPVPLHPKKETARGYNQADILARGMSENIQIVIDNKSLVRLSHNKSQTRKGRYDRYKNTKDLFRVTRPKMLEHKHVCLIDDVITTGSTIESCAEALQTVKGVKISVMSLAVAT